MIEIKSSKSITLTVSGDVASLIKGAMFLTDWDSVPNAEALFDALDGEGVESLELQFNDDTKELERK